MQCTVLGPRAQALTGRVQMPRLSPHLKGLTLAFAGILALSPDSVLVRLIRADAFSLLFWRGLLLFLVLGAGLTLQRRSALAACARIQ